MWRLISLASRWHQLIQLSESSRHQKVGVWTHALNGWIQCHCAHWSSQIWDNTEADLCDCVLHVVDLLLHRLRTVQQSIDLSLGTDTKVVLLPAACIKGDCTIMSEVNLLRHVGQLDLKGCDVCKSFCAKYLWRYHNAKAQVNAEFQFPDCQVAEWTQWSKEHSLKWDCQHFCLWVSCQPVTMASYVLWCTTYKPSLVVPEQYLGMGLQSWGNSELSECPRRGDQHGDEEGRQLAVVIGSSRPRVINCKKTIGQLETVDPKDNLAWSSRACT